MTNDPRVFPLPGLGRPVKKKDLEILLEKVERHPSPSPRLEQYQTPAAVAADVLFWAAQLGDIQGRKGVDLGGAKRARRSPVPGGRLPDRAGRVLVPQRAHGGLRARLVRGPRRRGDASAGGGG